MEAMKVHCFDNVSVNEDNDIFSGSENYFLKLKVAWCWVLGIATWRL